jgi:hypothetical protein
MKQAIFLQVVKARVEDLEVKERLYANKTNYGKEPEGTESLPTEQSQTERRKQQQDPLDRPEWNKSIRTESEMDKTHLLVLDDDRIRKVHSSKSMRVMVDQVKRMNEEEIRPASIAVPAPVVITHPGNAKEKDPPRPSNLPFLYRHPAI